MMVVLWKILTVSELLKILGLKARDESRYLHSVVFLAQDFGVVEEMYKFTYSGKIYSDELEKDIEVLRYVNVDFGRGRVNRIRAERLKEFIKDRETATKIAERVYAITRGHPVVEGRGNRYVRNVLHSYMIEKAKIGVIT